MSRELRSFMSETSLFKCTCIADHCADDPGYDRGPSRRSEAWNFGSSRSLSYLESTSRKITWLKRSSAAFCSKDNSSQTKDSAQAAEVCPITVDERSSIRRDNTGVYS